MGTATTTISLDETLASERGFVCDANCVISAVLMKQSVSRQAFDRARALGAFLIYPRVI